TKQVYLAGLACGLVSMSLLLVSVLFETATSAAFPLLLVATALLGARFGLTVPALKTLTAAFHPAAVASSVLVLNALLGRGRALAAVCVAICVGLGFWWGLPLLSAVLLALLVLASAGLPLRSASRPRRRPRATLRRGPASRRGSGFTRRSPCFTACARP